MLFVLIGMITSLVLRSQSMALFAAVSVWALITFATPQFTSGLRPVASLNPVTDPVQVSKSPFFKVTSKAKPVSIGEQYKALGTTILTEGKTTTASKAAGRLAPFALFGLLLTGWAGLLVRRHDFSEDTARD